jgi:KaiC/GvpD/RAD55 family RecA-like ATPase
MNAPPIPGMPGGKNEGPTIGPPTRLNPNAKPTAEEHRRRFTARLKIASKDPETEETHAICPCCKKPSFFFYPDDDYLEISCNCGMPAISKAVGVPVLKAFPSAIASVGTFERSDHFTYNEALAKPDIIAGVIRPGEIGVVYGAPSAGKSPLVEHFGFCVAAGTPCFSREVSQGLAVFLATEAPQSHELRKAARNKRFGRHEVPYYSSTEARDFTDQDHVDTLIRSLQWFRDVNGEGARLLIVDTMSATMPGADENLSSTMSAFVATLRRIMAEADVGAIVVVHHTPRGGEDPRGHSALVGNVDFLLHVQERADGLRVARFKKQRDEDCSGELVFGLEVVDLSAAQSSIVLREVDEDAPAIPAISSKARRALEILEEISKGEPIKASDWRAALERDGVVSGEKRESLQKAAQRVFKELVDAGRVQHNAENRTYTPATAGMDNG